ncbi:hypothetical protein [Gordonia sp. (in: high G+C Gram-positive bacteria)]|uniref:hypothetical protein n=1 Tax=Gordonia sp. (in: high G+C Gram-positive bacteria) TaxID=84139 RepID=UPI0033400F51
MLAGPVIVPVIVPAQQASGDMPMWVAIPIIVAVVVVSAGVVWATFGSWRR